MVVGFVLTGVLGGFLTHSWHLKEYTYKAKLEQEYSRIKAHQQAWGNLYNKIFDQTSDFIVAVERVISIYEYSISSPGQRKEIRKNFNSVSNDWLKESVVIRGQLKLIYFKKEPQDAIDKIMEEWTSLITESKTLNRHVAELATRYRVEDKSSELTKKFNKCKELLQRFTERVHNFGDNLNSAIFFE